MRLLRFSVVASLCCLGLGGCAIGVQQAVFAPGIHGSWAFSGVDRTLQGPAGAATPLNIPLHANADGGNVERILSPTQVVLALDLPFARVSIAPALLGRDDLELIQFDMLYKHLWIDEPAERWWLLGGFSAVIFNAGLSTTQPLHLSEAVRVDGHSYGSGATLNYTARRDASALYATLGAQRELTGWCHAFVELLVRLSAGSSSVETATLQDSGSSTDIFPNAHGFTSTTQRTGQVTANFELPWVVLAVGLHFDFPSYHFVRRLVHLGAGKAAFDQASELPATQTESSP